jgi:uncharacterized heparinase superfamily protein
MQQLRVFFWSLWYLKPSMIYWRIHRTIKAMLISVLEKAGVTERLFRRGPDAVPATPLPVLSSRYHCEHIDINAGRFSFLRDVVTLNGTAAEIRAAVADQPLLWQFHYGYHDYLLALLQRDGADEGLLPRVVEFALQWDSIFALHTPASRRSAWHPYVLSIRIESWVRLHGLAVHHGWPTDEPRLCRLAAGVEQMTAVLLNNLERGTMANHLLRNIKALVLAGLVLDTGTGASARRIGMRLLERELREQVLADGCHFERSPMYHVSVLNDVLDMAEAIVLAGSTVPETLSAAAAAMTEFLRRTRHPDGDIPMLNDSTRSFFLQTNEVLARGIALCEDMQAVAPEAPTPSAQERKRLSGLLTAGTQRLWLVLDAGIVGPDYQPGHAHCDTLGIELSVDGRRWITDTGVFHYRESPERSYSRSTAAHSTIQIEGMEQSEMWKSFRVGRRAGICLMHSEIRDGLHILRGAHDGYSRYSRGLLHERAAIAGDDWLLIVDWLHGSGRQNWHSRIHLHPDVTVSKKEHCLQLEYRGSAATCMTIGDADSSVETCEMYPAFGEKVDRSVIHMHGNAELPLMTGFLLTFGEARPSILPHDENNMALHVQGLLIQALAPTKQR